MTQPGGGSRVLVATATYNEAGNIQEWHQRVRAAFPEADLMIVDDNSPDGTAGIVRQIQEQDPRVELLVRPGKSGLGSAHRAAMLHSLENGYDVLVTMDADLSHQPEELPPFLTLIPEFDFVIGTRAGKNGCDYTGVRRFLSTGGNLAARALIPTGLTEYTTSMRAFSPHALQAVFTHGIRDDGYAFFMETVEILYRSGCRMTEVPIHFLDRTRGNSKIPRNQIWLSASTLGRLAASRVMHRGIREAPRH